MAEEEDKVNVSGEATEQVNGEQVALPWDGKLNLRKAVVANGQEVKQIVFREPTGGDIEACGNPVMMPMIVEATPLVHIKEAAMTAMMARLAAVPPSTIRAMDPRDWNNGAYKLVRFFLPDFG